MSISLSNIGSSFEWLNLGSNFTWNDILTAIGVLIFLMTISQLVPPNVEEEHRD